jgi:hypothetical protein
LAISVKALLAASLTLLGGGAASACRAASNEKNAANTTAAQRTLGTLPAILLTSPASVSPTTRREAATGSSGG